MLSFPLSPMTLSNPASVSSLAAFSPLKNVTCVLHTRSIVGVTNMCKQVQPDQVMAYLNELFTAFDALVDTYQIYKVGEVFGHLLGAVSMLRTVSSVIHNYFTGTACWAGVRMGQVLPPCLMLMLVLSLIRLLH